MQPWPLFRSRRFLVVVLVLLLVGCASKGPPQQDDFARQWRGQTAPSINLTRLDGSSFRLSEYRNKKIVILNFFGTWCPPCRAEIPALDEFYHRHEKKVVLVGVSQNEKDKAVRKFLDNLNVDFPVVMDPRSGAVSERFRVPTLPTTVVINRDGRVAYYRPGMLRRWDYEYLERLVNNNGSEPSG